MRAVMISIQPKWVEKIANGEKTIEVRKTAPKLETPFKCYIYCTKPDVKSRVVIGSMAFYNDELYRTIDGEIKYGSSIELMACPPESYSRDNFLNGKVIGEFICDKIFNTNDWIYSDEIAHIFTEKNMCLSYKELAEYLNGKEGYCWHISALKIYDEPKDISEFNTLCKMPKEVNCENCPFYDWYEAKCVGRKVTRPPKGWCYVEEIRE